MPTTLLHTVEIESKPQPTVAIIWMHGLGADANDFIPIVHELDLHDCPSIRFVFPNAPSIPVTVNGGYVMPAWYDIRGEDITKREDEVGLRLSQQRINTLIEREIERGIATDHIIIAGFSQGCAMSLQVGLRHPKKLGGIMCLSGYAPLAEEVAAERHPANQATPIFMAHGISDPVVPLQRAQYSRDLLLNLAYQIEWHEYNMQHSVCQEEIVEIGNWLRSILNK